MRPVDIDEPARALDVDEVDGVRRDDGDVDLEGLAVAQDLEVVQDEVARRQVIPQVRDDLTLGVVHRLADRDHRGHQLPSLDGIFDNLSGACLVHAGLVPKLLCPENPTANFLPEGLGLAREPRYLLPG